MCSRRIPVPRRTCCMLRRQGTAITKKATPHSSPKRAELRKLSCFFQTIKMFHCVCHTAMCSMIFGVITHKRSPIIFFNEWFKTFVFFRRRYATQQSTTYSHIPETEPFWSKTSTPRPHATWRNFRCECYTTVALSLGAKHMLRADAFWLQPSTGLCHRNLFGRKTICST